MLPESLKPLQAKSQVLFARNGAGAPIPNQIIPADPRRHTLIITVNGNTTLTLDGISDPLDFIAAVNNTIRIYTYDNFGDLIHRTINVSTAAGTTQMLIIQTIIEQPPVIGDN